MRSPKLKGPESVSNSSPLRAPSPTKPHVSPKHVTFPAPIPPADSGYHGSQSEDTVEDRPAVAEGSRLVTHALSSPKKAADHVAFHVSSPMAALSPTRTKVFESPEPTHTFQTAKEEQTTTRVMPESTATIRSPIPVTSPVSSPYKDEVAMLPAHSSPKKSSPAKSSPLKPGIAETLPPTSPATAAHDQNDDGMQIDDATHSPSDGSSPIRPVVRKSSLNFASLPAREPLTSNKSLGARISRTSHIDHNRTSYYGRPTGGKSLGNVVRHDAVDTDDHEEMDIDHDAALPSKQDDAVESITTTHNKTYTQRLQDQINMLGQSQANAAKQPKTMPSLVNAQPATHTSNASSSQANKPASPLRKPVAPGAFPDDEDEWIDPPAVPEHGSDVFSPRPGIAKGYSTDVMEGIRKNTIGGTEFVLPKQRNLESRPVSPIRAPLIPERTTSAFSHTKSASVSALSEFGLPGANSETASIKKGISVSNPTLATVSEAGFSTTPSKSPSRNFRDSPLKQVKNKLSSILKSSKGLLASSAAISAEGKTSMLSPSTTRLGFHAGPSVESIAPQQELVESLYPDLSRHVGVDTQTISSNSPPRPISRRTRASVEREKEEKRKEKEAKLMAEQMDKLEKAREKERERARVFSQEKEKATTVDKRVASNKEKAIQAETAKEPPKPTRTSPRKAKAQLEAEAKAAEHDIEMADASTRMPPPSVPRSAGTASTARTRELKRPTKPTKEPASKTKQAPTIIRVNTVSQHSQFHPSNSTLAATLHDTLGSAVPQQSLTSKASKASLQTKPSIQSLKSSVSSNGRPKALELAAKRKEQEEKEAQRKRDAKLEIERKRAAALDEERKLEQQRRLEAEKQKERERTDVKKNAERQAAIEKAKQTRAPPPAVRSQPNGPPDYKLAQEKPQTNPASQRSEAPPSRPPSRLTSTLPRPQDDNHRHTNVAKTAPKRPLAQDGNDAHTRSGPGYQAKDAKRRRTSEDFDGDADMESQPNIKGPPVRPSGGFKKVCFPS
jgi:hypothetical protein